MINIGTNFLYKGVLFLDDRQGIAKSKHDLLEWSILVPEGFEVYLNLENDPAWYTYNSNYWSDETGHFERRLDKGYVDSKIEEIWIEINEIWEYIHNININIPEIPSQITLTASISPSTGYKLPGSAFTPQITWSLKNFSTPIPYSSITAARVIINGTAQTMSQVQSPWVAPAPIGTTTGNFSYKLQVDYNNSTYSSNTFTYNISPYTWYKWFGVSNNPAIISISELSGRTQKQGWGSTSITDEHSFNCTGGVYPYYVFPKSLWDEHSGTFRMMVGALEVGGYVSGTISEGGKQYTTIRHGLLQNSNSLTIKYYEQ